MKNVGKPFTFKNDEAVFSTWTKKLKQYIGAGFGRDARTMMDWAEDRAAQVITDADLQSKFGEKLGLLSRVEEALYSNLSSFTEGEAFNLASNTTAGKGFEAFRKLCHRFDPQTAGRRTNICSSLNPPQVKLDELGSALEIWEEQVRQFEARRGPRGERKEIDDDLKIGALLSMVPNNLKEHLTLSNDSYGGVYQNVRLAITNYVEGRQGPKMKPLSLIHI